MLAEPSQAGLTMVSGDDVAIARIHGPFDLVVDMVGGEAFTSALSLLAPGGRMVVVGAASGAQSTMDAAAIYQNHLDIIGFALFPTLSAKPATGGLKRLFRLAAEGNIQLPKVGLRPAFAPNVLGTRAGCSRIVLVFDAASANGSEPSSRTS